MIKNKISVLVALVIVLLTISSCEAQKNSKEGTIAKDLNVSEFKKLVEANPTGQIIDVRTPEEQAQGYVTGAKFVDFFEANFDTEIAKLDKTKPVYVYCKSGGRSGKAMKKMNSMGFSEVYNLNGGMMAWEGAKYPTKK